MGNKKQKMLIKKFLLAQSSPRHCLKKRDGLLAQNLARAPVAAHRNIASCTQFVCPCKWAELGKRYLNSFPIPYLFLTSSVVLYFGWLFYILCFAQQSVKKSQSAQENYVLSIPFVTRGSKCWTPLRRLLHKVFSPHLREGFNVAWGLTAWWSLQFERCSLF